MRSRRDSGDDEHVVPIMMDAAGVGGWPFGEPASSQVVHLDGRCFDVEHRIVTTEHGWSSDRSGLDDSVRELLQAAGEDSSAR